MNFGKHQLHWANMDKTGLLIKPHNMSIDSLQKMETKI